jgi:hypothetical protein
MEKQVEMWNDMENLENTEENGEKMKNMEETQVEMWNDMENMEETQVEMWNNMENTEEK